MGPVLDLLCFGTDGLSGLTVVPKGLERIRVYGLSGLTVVPKGPEKNKGLWPFGDNCQSKKIDQMFILVQLSVQ